MSKEDTGHYHTRWPI